MDSEPENTGFLSGKPKPNPTEEKSWDEVIEDWWKGYKMRALLAYYGTLANLSSAVTKASSEEREREMEEVPPPKRQKRV